MKAEVGIKRDVRHVYRGRTARGDPAEGDSKKV